MKKMNYKRIFVIIVLSVVALFVSLSFLGATFAYYASLPRVYTSENDNTGQIARIGMRINLLFDKLDPDEVSTNTDLVYPDGTEDGYSVKFNPEARWGTAANPYIIDKPRHMMNLYALQKAGYFYDKFISENYTNGEYNGGSSMPYFRVCDVDGDPVTVDGKKADGTNVKINPIGTDRYPFIGRIAGSINTGTATYQTSNKTWNSSSSIIANFLVDVKDEVDVGLFGTISYLGDSSNTSTDNNGNTVFTGTISSVTDLLLYDIQVVSHQDTFLERLADHMFADDIPNKNIEFDEDHHVGILAGHIEYSSITNISVYYSSNDVVAIDVDQEGANYYSDSGIIGFVFNLNPQVTGSSVGSNTGTTLAGTIDGTGDEWGGSINMLDLHTRLQNILSIAKGKNTDLPLYQNGTPRYVSSETLTITMGIVDGEEVETDRQTSNQVYSNIANYASSDIPEVYISSDLENGSFSFADFTDQTTRYDMFHGTNTTYTPKTLTTYTIHANGESGYLIYSGSNYLNATVSNDVVNLGNINSSTNAVVWEIDSDGYINARLETSTTIKKYYLKSTNGTLSLVDNKANGTAFVKSNTGEITYTTSNAGVTITWQLIYESGWKCVPYKTSYTFTNGTYYINANAGALAGGNASNTEWGVTNDGYIYTLTNNNIYFINYSSQNGFELSTTNKIAFDLSNNQMKFTYNTTTYYVVYNASIGNWDVIVDLNPIVIYTGTNYLKVNNGSIVNGTSANATNWTFNGTTGTISTLINGKTYYLYGTTSLSISDTNSTTWTYADNKFYYDYSSNRYYLTYTSGGWTVLRNGADISGTFIKVGGQYLKATSTTAFSFVDDIADATKWTINGNYYQTTISNQTYYLCCNRNSSTINLSNNSNTAFQLSNGTLRYAYTGWGTTYYYLLNDNGTPKVSTTIYNGTGYYIKDTNNNLYMDNDSSTYTVTASSTPTTIWVWNGTYFANSDSDNRRLEYYSNTYNVIAFSQTSGYYTLDSSNRLVSNDTRYVTYNNGWTSGNAGNAHTFEMIPVAYTKSTNAEIVTINAGSVTQNISKANGSVNSTMNSNSSNKAVNNVSASEREFKEKTVATVPGGYDSYFPLAAETTSPFAVDIKNTGYIVGGSHTTQQSESGDVRVSSYYDITYLRTALNGSQSSTTYSDSKLEVLTRTYLSNGLKRISDSYNSGNSNNNVSSSIRSYTKTSVGDLGLQKYDTARDQLKDVFAKDSSRVYGMHFMNAAISISNLIVAPKVVINGSTYANYQMPEDSIDFRLKTKGYINFFAGTYYAPSGGTANNSFFSLYEINRNAVTNKITSIKHIEKIYGDPTSETKQYLYKYEGESAPSLPTGYVEMFDCSWIESPTMVNYSMYYYEIPVNAGEYALGSVEGKYGAYLCYLDIGASAASHQSVLGSIDFVYDNLSNKIVTVKDYSDSDTSLNYYIPSYVVIYTRNTDKENGNFVKINNFTIKTRRSIASVNDGKATITSTLAGDDNAHLQVVATSSLGDNLSTTGGYVSS